MHGDKSQGQRERALAGFEAGRVDTLVATDVAARGIDVADITHVINYDAPAAREDYVHRVGRTARAGARGVGITFVMDEQARDMAKIARDLGLGDAVGDAGSPGRAGDDGHPATAARPVAAARPAATARPAGRASATAARPPRALAGASRPAAPSGHGDGGARGTVVASARPRRGRGGVRRGRA